jgi:hypothetical protein
MTIAIRRATARKCRLTRHHAVTASARAYRFFAVTCRITFFPARDLPQMWVKPRKVNEVPFVSGWLALLVGCCANQAKSALGKLALPPQRLRCLCWAYTVHPHLLPVSLIDQRIILQIRKTKFCRERCASPRFRDRGRRGVE